MVTPHLILKELYSRQERLTPVEDVPLFMNLRYRLKWQQASAAAKYS